VSDPSRTIVDILDVPRLGGGIRTVTGVLDEHLHGENRNDQLLVDYGDRLGNRAVFKRLGYLLERSAIAAPELVQACLERRSSGLVALDPSAGTRGRIVRRWGLRVNDTLGTQRAEW
jgi:predicted transcriptional regulator of viral defense system